MSTCLERDVIDLLRRLKKPMSFSTLLRIFKTQFGLAAKESWVLLRKFNSQDIIVINAARETVSLK